MSTLPANDSIRFLQLDVFTERPGGGNPLGVVLDAQGWDADDMQRFAVWTNLVETTFLLPATEPGADYRLRIFTPTREIPFAGHPTIGSACAALATGFVARASTLVQQCGAGLLPIHVEDDGRGEQLFVQAPPARVLREGRDADPQLRALLAQVELGTLPPAFVEGGRCWWVAELADEAAVRGWHPNHASIHALALASNSLGLCVFARCARRDYDVVVRAFPAGVGIVEDPASGAANGLIAAYIAAREPQGELARGYRVSQGREIGKDARILIRFEPGNGVWVGGRSHIVIDGRIRWPLGAD
jgi:PhzF family phenazine biosynthesis protein